MSRIKAPVEWDESSRGRFYRYFTVIDKLPEKGELIYGGDREGDQGRVTKIVSMGIVVRAISRIEGERLGVNMVPTTYKLYRVEREYAKWCRGENAWIADDIEILFVAIKEK